MLLCLFACEKEEVKDNGTPITDQNVDSEQNESKDDTVPDSDDKVENVDPPGDETIVSMFSTYYELEKWFADKTYETECFVTDKSDPSKSYKFDNLVRYGREITDKVKDLYYPYMDGKRIEDISLLRVMTYYSSASPVIFFHINESEHCERAIVSYNHIEDKYKDTSLKDSKDIFIPDLKVAYDGIEYEFTESKVSFANRTLFAYRTYFPCFPVGKTAQYYYQFIFEDKLISITLYEKDSIEEFLDGFELRPIDLTTFSTAEKE